MDLTDKEYVQHCRDGHPDDFRLLVHRYQGPLFSYGLAHFAAYA